MSQAASEVVSVPTAVERRVRELQAARPRSHSGFALLLVEPDDHAHLARQHGAEEASRATDWLAGRLGSVLRRIDSIEAVTAGCVAIVLGDTSGVPVEIMAERVRQRAEQDLYELVSGKPMAMTASIGGATWLGEQDSAAALLARANRALASARKVRNMAVLWHDRLEDPRS